MSSPKHGYLDGNAASCEVIKVFAIDMTTAGNGAPNVALRDARRRHCHVGKAKGACEGGSAE